MRTIRGGSVLCPCTAWGIVTLGLDPLRLQGGGAPSRELGLLPLLPPEMALRSQAVGQQRGTRTAALVPLSSATLGTQPP